MIWHRLDPVVVRWRHTAILHKRGWTLRGYAGIEQYVQRRACRRTELLSRPTVDSQHRTQVRPRFACAPTAMPKSSLPMATPSPRTATAMPVITLSGFPAPIAAARPPPRGSICWSRRSERRAVLTETTLTRSACSQTTFPCDGSQTVLARRTNSAGPRGIRDARPRYERDLDFLPVPEEPAWSEWAGGFAISVAKPP